MTICLIKALGLTYERPLHHFDTLMKKTILQDKYRNSYFFFIVLCVSPINMNIVLSNWIEKYPVLWNYKIRGCVNRVFLHFNDCDSWGNVSNMTKMVTCEKFEIVENKLIQVDLIIARLKMHCYFKLVGMQSSLGLC